jgi:S1-C subfamily serine protease
MPQSFMIAKEMFGLLIIVVIFSFPLLLSQTGYSSTTSEAITIPTSATGNPDVSNVSTRSDIAPSSAILSSLFNQVNGSVLEIITHGETSNPKISINGMPLGAAFESTGSGFIYDKRGNIVTNYHVIENAQQIYVKFSSGNSYPAKLIGQDIYSDLAVIQVCSSALFKERIIPLPLADSSSDYKVGDPVVAIGSPQGLTSSLSQGIVSQVNRVNLDLITNTFFTGDLIQTDADINPGNSGGPLLNLNGEVIGVNDLILLDPETGAALPGLNFAISSNTVKRVVPSLITQGSYSHPWLGIKMIDVNPFVADTLGLENASGIFITTVLPDSPAELAGIEPGNIIFGIDRKVTRDIAQFVNYIEGSKSPGDNVVLYVLTNDGASITVPVVLGERQEVI